MSLLGLYNYVDEVNFRPKRGFVLVYLDLFRTSLLRTLSDVHEQKDNNPSTFRPVTNFTCESVNVNCVKDNGIHAIVQSIFERVYYEGLEGRQSSDNGYLDKVPFVRHS